MGYLWSSHVERKAKNDWLRHFETNKSGSALQCLTGVHKFPPILQVHSNPGDLKFLINQSANSNKMTYHIHDPLYHSCIQRLSLVFCFVTFSRPGRKVGLGSLGLGEADGRVDVARSGSGGLSRCLPPHPRGRAKRDKTGKLLPHAFPPLLRAEAPGKGAEGPGRPS